MTTTRFHPKPKLTLVVAVIATLSCNTPPVLADDSDERVVATGKAMQHAHEANPGPEHGESEDGEDAVPMLDSSRREVREATEWVARGADSWFGDIPFENGGKVTNGRIRTRVVWREHDEVDFNLRFRVSMRLPNLQDKVYVLVGSENERDLVRDRSDTIMDQRRLLQESKRDDETFFTGIGLRLLDDISVSVGLRDLHKPYVKLRYRYEWQVSESNQISFRETGFWALDDGFGATTTLDFIHTFSPVLRARWHNSGTISEEDDGLDWYTSLGLYRTFGEQRQLSGELLVDGETGKDVDIDEYGVLLKWQQPVYRDWLIGEITTGHYWERESIEHEREGKWAVGLGLQMHF
ncbi:MAG: hypothetical protein GX087_01870 [Desulfobulbaceae bacterium]|nr:hypothetical protein [Desulfobulbaceae bacterium]